MRRSPVALSATIDLPPGSRSVPTARHVVAELLASWDADRFRDDASLLVSELVTNVVRHVADRTPMVLELRLTGISLRVGVVDTSADRPVVQDRPLRDGGGHGLVLVAAVSHRWGSEADGRGKRVWFELLR